MKKQIISLAICLVFAAIATATGTANTTAPNSGNPGANNAGTADAVRIDETTMSRNESTSGTVQPRSTY